MLNCKEASRLLSEKQDHPLDWSKKVGLKCHLFLCRACRNFESQLDFMRTACHLHPTQSAIKPEEDKEKTIS